MVPVNKTTVLVAAGLAGACFIGYCVYFDQKRRSDPDYMKKVSERRMQERQEEEAQQQERQKKELDRQNILAARERAMSLPDNAAIDRFFLEQIQAAAAKIDAGDFERAVDHYSNAVFVCGHPANLLTMLETSLPPPVYIMLMRKMHEKGDRIQAELLRQRLLPPPATNTAP